MLPPQQMIDHVYKFTDTFFGQVAVGVVVALITAGVSVLIKQFRK